ncbi:DUF1501 domain-containing protein [Humisphaera borealis]|uniref:DUF1501 domain-containing protein n=1 Tax=Humisphaera borealis TaxID=2807512 RepID=A0A7M2WVL3_9BACT|nr:DUF1501 domain-containing protein [Humisphaera borealis]QOV89463.1 DUF1501 domain-containing protein [Humisphaera borealis]
MLNWTRRQWLANTGAGFGLFALRGMMGADAARAAENGVPLASAASISGANVPHYAAKAKAVIFLFMYGGPSHIDLFDPKPTLEKYAGKPIPTFRPEDAFMAGKTKNAAMPSPYAFKKYGSAGIDISEKYPEVAKLADELAVIRSMHCESNNHGPALFQMQSGSRFAGRPAMGSWVTYGLGTENANLPSFVVLMDHQGAPVNGAMNWSNGFMPANYQGVPFRSGATPIAYLNPPAGVSDQQQRARLDLLSKWNEKHLAENPGESALAARIASYELAYHMQSHAAEAVDLSKESAATQSLYGIDNKVSQHFGRNCLLARRLVERGVRYVQLYSGGNEGPKAWDAHDDLKKNHDLHCAETDVPIAGLLRDLKSRGMLDSTLVIWGGEFGRTPTAEAGKGRDHHARAFSVWLAGGGVKGGVVHGVTDDFGYNVVENGVSVPDLHATALHLLGLDHKRLTYPFMGRNFRLTDVSGDVVKQVLA